MLSQVRIKLGIKAVSTSVRWISQRIAQLTSENTLAKQKRYGKTRLATCGLRER